VGLGAAAGGVLIGSASSAGRHRTTGWPASEEPPTRRRLLVCRAARILASIVLVVLTFMSGHERLAHELARARRGADLAARLGRDASWLVDARVAARRSTEFGEEVELFAVEGRLAEAVLPERLILSIARPAVDASLSADPSETSPTSNASDASDASDVAGISLVSGVPDFIVDAVPAVPAVPAASEPGAAAPTCECEATGCRIGDRGEGSRAEALLWPGARVRLAVRIVPLHPARNPGSPDREQTLARRGIGARARLVKADWVVETIADSGVLARARAALVALRRDGMASVRRRLGPCYSGAGLARALSLGDRRDLSASTRRSFRELGLAHLLSVSGLHVGFVAFPVAAAVGRLRVLARRRAWPVRRFSTPIAVGALAGLAYAWLTGANVPAERASLLLALFGLFRAMRGSLAPAPALALVASSLLIQSPAVLFESGARFSFTACIALVATRIWDPLRPVPRAAAKIDPAANRPGLLRRGLYALAEPLRGSLAISLGLLAWVELAGLPRSPMSPLFNGVAIPWAGLVVLPCALVAAMLAWGLPTGWGEGLFSFLLWPAALLELAAGRAWAALPADWMGADRPGRIPWLIGVPALGLALAALRSGRTLPAGILWLVLGGAGLAPLREAPLWTARPRVVFFDMGQADAALIETREASWLIDSGSGSEAGSGGGTLLRGLRALGVERLDALVITHGDLDHRGGAARILAAMPVAELWLPALERPDPALSVLAAEARRQGVHVRGVGLGDRRESGDGFAVEVLWPPLPARIPSGRAEERGQRLLGDARAAPGRARNEASIVLRATVEGRALLFMADAGTAVEQRLRAGGAPLRADLLKVGHHGSRQSSDARFLAAVGPQLSIVSAPCDGARGLPSPVALARLRASGSAIGWTGRDGAIAVTWAADGPLHVRTWGQARDCERR
jgi:competence protein ComEC